MIHANIESFQGLSDKRRLMAAFRGEKTDRVPHFEILIAMINAIHRYGAY